MDYSSGAENIRRSLSTRFIDLRTWPFVFRTVNLKSTMPSWWWSLQWFWV